MSPSGQVNDERNSLDHDLLHPPFLGLMDLPHIGGTGNHIAVSECDVHNTRTMTHTGGFPAHSLSNDTTVAPNPRNTHNTPMIMELTLHSGHLQADLPLLMKRRLLHFLYAADQPLSLVQFSIIPAINTLTRLFESNNILDLQPHSAQQNLSSWFGRLVKFNPAHGTVGFSDECQGQSPQWYAENLREVFISREEAHGEALLVCATYLLLSSGGSGADQTGGLGFQYSEDNNLSEILDRIRASASEPDSLHPESEVPPFYSLLEYATLNWPRHLACITPYITNNKRTISNGISIAALRMASFILSFQYLTWLESLNYILCGNSQHDSEPIALTQALVYGTFKRWVRANASGNDNSADVKLFYRALHWLRILQSMDILAQIPAAANTFTVPRRKAAICQLLQEESATLGPFELLSERDCDVIANYKPDLGYHKYIMGLISTRREPCVIDHGLRVAFYVVQTLWSGGALQLECVDLETGLILGRDSIWTKRFFGWNHRVIIVKNATHLALQLIAEKYSPDKSQKLLMTYVWEVKTFENCKLGNGVISKGWMIDSENEVQTMTTGDNSDPTPINLYHTGHLILERDTHCVQTPSGAWDLQTRKRIGDCIMNCSLVLASEGNASEAHVDWSPTTNTCSKTFLKEFTPQRMIHTFCQLLGAPTENVQRAGPHGNLSEAPRDFIIRYAAFSLCGERFLAQIEYLSPFSLETSTKDLVWVLAEREGEEWMLRGRVNTDESQFWPLDHSWTLEGSEVREEKERFFRDMGPICSVHPITEGSLTFPSDI